MKRQMNSEWNKSFHIGFVYRMGYSYNPPLSLITVHSCRSNMAAAISFVHNLAARNMLRSCAEHQGGNCVGWHPRNNKRTLCDMLVFSTMDSSEKIELCVSFAHEVLLDDSGY